MKNFKRVISAVIALALSASTLVAVSASKFADVDSTNYAEAIDVLTALDIVHGYDEEGGLVFKPEGEITRAEAATMIVGALNMTADAQAAAGTSKFTDVNEKASWATGYVNVGVAQGFINGMDDTTFAPQENVTYAQMCVMLTLITGYGDYAKSYGGWPTGYTTMAASAGINKGVAVSNDTPLKRGQVAQMLYNAITAPVLGITEYRLDGNTYSKLDGSGSNEYKTIISDKFDGYVVKATVDSFPNAGEVKLTKVTSDYKKATNSDKYFSAWSESDGGTINKAIIENGVDLTNSIQQQVRAILYVDANEKIHLVYATQTDSIETKEVAADDFEKMDYKDSAQIKFGSTKYTFANAVTIYVNGEKFGKITRTPKVGDTPASASYTAESGAATPDGSTAEKKFESIINAATGDIKLAKVAANASNYDTIFVEAYVMGQVTNVSYKNEVTTIKFTRANNNLGSYKKIEIADNDIDTDQVKVSVTFDGKEIALKDIQENDIIAVKTNINTDDTIDKDNKNITVLVARETISGRVTSIEKGTGENAFVIDSTEYAAVDKDGIELKVGEIYNTIYLDAFGRIFTFDDEAVEDTKKYAILARVSDKTDIVLVLPDGTRKAYEAKNNDIYPSGAKALEISGTTDKVTADTDVLNCVVEYTVKNGQINSISKVSGTTFNGQYKASVGKVGTVGISDASGIINTDDVSSYKDYASMKASDFADEEVYVGAGFGKVGATSNYSLVVVTSAGFAYGAKSRFAIVNADSWSQGLDADGDSVDQLKVLVNGEKTTLSFKNKSIYTGFGYGDAFFYHVDSDGLVDKVRSVALADITTAAQVDLSGLFGSGNYDPDKWETNMKGSKDIKLVKGLVVKSGTSTVSLLATPTDDAPADFDDFEQFKLADDCLIYTYDSDSEVADKDKLDEEASLVAMQYKDWTITEAPGRAANGDIPAIAAATGYDTTSIGKVAWGFKATSENTLIARGIKATKFAALENEQLSDYAQYALALIVDDEVVEIYEILADK